MPRINRVAIGDMVYHVLNRSNGQVTIFHTDEEYRHFESLLLEAKELVDMVEIKLKNKTGRLLSL